MSFRVLIVWCMMLLVPVQSFAGAGLLRCDVLNSLWNAASVGGQLQQGQNPLRGNVEDSTPHATGTSVDAKDAAVEAHSIDLLASTLPASHYQHNHHAHKHPCCDGTPAVHPTVNTTVTAPIDPLPVATPLATSASIFLEGPKRPPRLLIA